MTVRHRWLRTLSIFVAAVWSMVAVAEDFVLGPGDKVAVSVHGRPDLSGEFRVLPAGSLSLPFVQSVSANGRTLTEVRDIVARRIREDAFLIDPRVTIDLVEARPVAIAGEVRRPGSYPYHLGMTVLHAVSAAGGRRVVDLEAFAAHAEIGRLRERLRLSLEASGLGLIRGARLKAELAEADSVAMPAGIEAFLDEARARQSLRDETGLLTERLAAHRGQLAVMARQSAIYEEEIQALTDQAASKVREGELLREEVAYVEDLLKKGLTPRTSRLIELRRMVVQAQGEGRQIAAAIAKARQEIGRLEQARLVLTSQRIVELTGALKDNEDGQKNLRITIEELRLTLRDANEIAPGPGQIATTAPGATGFSILRQRGGGQSKLAATSETQLLPGDLVEVTRQ